MKTNYIDQEIDKIMADKTLEFPHNLALACSWVAANFKGENLKILDVGTVGPLTDYFLLVTATNVTQALAIASEIGRQIKRLGFKVYSKEGLDGSEWILLDGGDVIVHIFQPQARDIYDLDQLWEKAPLIEIPADYYFGAPAIDLSQPQEPETSGEYF